MNINEIKQAALVFTSQNKQELSDKIKKLKDQGIPFPECVVFTQYNQQISLLEAKNLTLELAAWTDEEKAEIKGYISLMMSEFEEED
ncbi:hypothetical protein SAMN05421786_11425 [Chryseobacterium ureilyticum]|uniref:Uncharacterized protein n=1 Tax=Chryseobacterium ureilyticum TaxID=373668 RepID=A0A1N7QQ37_9FLAO|nr:hypothetical protein [Chryseobacterium ureilyticum]SIT24983.1 hypothetical protein SAMN05421786_11425 [Chryseobacterium ureilyticum]